MTLKRTELKRKTPMSQSRLFADRTRHTPYRPKKCKGCGEEYTPISGNQLYCTKACYWQTALVERVCEQCGEKFTRHQQGPTTRFCSWRCRDTKRYGERMVITCPSCGVEFEKRRENQRWCSRKCGHALRQRRRRADTPRGHNWSVKLKGEEDCRNCGRPASHLHHIVPRSKSRIGRLELERNGLPLCADCHRGWHDRTVTIYEERLTEIELAFAREHGGLVWVERNYPVRRSDELNGERPYERKAAA